LATNFYYSSAIAISHKEALGAFLQVKWKKGKHPLRLYFGRLKKRQELICVAQHLILWVVSQ
jgi:hypothetical protein